MSPSSSMATSRCLIMPTLRAATLKLPRRLVSMPRPMPSSTTKSASAAISLSLGDTFLRSMTQLSVPVEATERVPSARACARVGSTSATSFSHTLSSAAVTSLMAAISLAAITTVTPLRMSSRAKGTMPMMMSEPELSQNMTAFLKGAPWHSVRASSSRSRSSTHQGRGCRLFRVSWNLGILPELYMSAPAAAPRSKMLPAMTPRTTVSKRSRLLVMASISCSSCGRKEMASAVSDAFTALKQSAKPCSLKHRSLMADRLTQLTVSGAKPGRGFSGWASMSFSTFS
mmetsp:Transcript_17514/g.52570  ORF Transcript_17514/g.52570 Transcript_17514/m.52570 type:complete len:286 (-) Transcript_17514:555-1412(-)